MDSSSPKAKLVGRGAGISPPNRFEHVHAEDDWEHLDPSERSPMSGAVPTVLDAQRDAAADHRERQPRRSAFATASIPIAAASTAAPIAMPGPGTKRWA